MSFFTEILSILLLSVGLSMDSLALAVSCGLQYSPHKQTEALKVAIIFALTQATTPIIGYFSGKLFANLMAPFDHWVAFILLALIGGHMIKEGISHHNGGECIERKLTLWVLFTMGVATSIDALAAGISLIATNLNIPLTIFSIFIGTFIFSYCGYMFGKKLGDIFQVKAEIFGGIVLVLLGIKIVVEHLFFQ
ncbi:MAG: hypothetical protein DRO88_05200 [Promethearchaeia archaeon]|nr:MAG: hypothetical protein DRO88_05200 [Candidatus Lokiarchaeia archaeon]